MTAAASRLLAKPPLPGSMLSYPSVKDAGPKAAAFWGDLISFVAPESLVSAAGVRLQMIERDGTGEVNLDHYVVRIRRLPTLEGSKFEPSALLTHVRKNLASFLDPAYAKFEPYDDEYNKKKWESDAPLGALVHFRVKLSGWNLDDATVIAALSRPRRWIFSTVSDVQNLAHPVSGNREFGLRDSPDGTWQLYTRGADRVAAFSPARFMPGPAFEGADKLWRSFQARASHFINANGGQAEILPPTSARHPWEPIRAKYLPQ